MNFMRKENHDNSEIKYYCSWLCSFYSYKVCILSNKIKPTWQSTTSYNIYVIITILLLLVHEIPFPKNKYTNNTTERCPIIVITFFSTRSYHWCHTDDNSTKNLKQMHQTAFFTQGHSSLDTRWVMSQIQLCTHIFKTMML